MPTPIVYLNGAFLPQDRASIPLLDRGFMFGDGVYEVIPAYGGRLFRLEQHLQRLDNSLAAIRLTNPLTRDQWHAALEELVARNGGGDQSVYLQVTRGPAPRNHAFPERPQPTVVAMSSALTGLTDDVLRDGVAAVTCEDIRWKYCHIKAITLLPNVLLRQQALDAGAAEAILVRDGLVTEGAASNVFMVTAGRVVTPPKGPYLLPGITRDLIIELAQDADLDCAEADIPLQALQGADEIWLSSSTREILPVTRLDGQPVGGGRPGPLWRRLYDRYQAYKDTLRQPATSRG
jgi:D-alanine transaminase